MCCKDEHGVDKVIIPLGVGHLLSEADPIEFMVYNDSPLTSAEAARRFHAWMRSKVNGVFYDCLRRELRDDPA